MKPVYSVCVILLLACCCHSGGLFPCDTYHLPYCRHHWPGRSPLMLWIPIWSLTQQLSLLLSCWCCVRCCLQSRTLSHTRAFCVWQTALCACVMFEWVCVCVCDVFACMCACVRLCMCTCVRACVRAYVCVWTITALSCLQVLVEWCSWCSPSFCQSRSSSTLARDSRPSVGGEKVVVGGYIQTIVVWAVFTT